MWSDYSKLKALQKKKSKIEELFLPFKAASEKLDYLFNSYDILLEEEGGVFLKDFTDELRNLAKDIEKLELKHLLYSEMDQNNAILEIHPGAGGVESQDWAQMLLRMYLRWAERKDFQSDILDLLHGEEAGIKSVTVSISGTYAYGYLKGEVGVHRLVRISPFDANSKRHTSFVAVLVYPEIEDDIAIDINEEELKIDTYRASGAGGQHVNKVSSAVRITHTPTGIVVSCQSGRSQYNNRATALKILKARLYDLKLKEKEEKLEDIIGTKKGIAWGNQIRSYTLHPYRLIKDHVTGLEIGDVETVLDGEIDKFINAYLKMHVKDSVTIA